MNANGAKVILEPIEGVRTEWDNVLEMFEDTLEHEIKVTGMIHDLIKLAFRINDFATVSRLQWFVDEQVEEEESARDMVCDLKRMENDYSLIRELDKGGWSDGHPPFGYLPSSSSADCSGTPSGNRSRPRLRERLSRTW